MKTTLIKTRRFKKESYLFYLNEPEYKGEKGPIGIELSHYVSVKTPENCFGYTDTILFTNSGEAYTLDRYLQPWILKECEKVSAKILDQWGEDAAG